MENSVGKINDGRRGALGIGDHINMISCSKERACCCYKLSGYPDPAKPLTDLFWMIKQHFRHILGQTKQIKMDNGV